MGKSTVARMFADQGVPVFDADADVHRLQGPDGALVAEIEAAFPGTTGPEASNRTALAERVLGDPDALQPARGARPPGGGAASARLSWPRNTDAPLVVLDIPLLFEKGGWNQVDKVAVVSAPPEVQRARVARPAGHDRGEVRANPRPADARCGEARARRFRHRDRQFHGRNNGPRFGASSLA